MKKFLLLVFLPLWAAAAEPTGGGYSPLAPLIGGVWSAPLPPGKDGTARSIELTFSWTPNAQGIRFDSAFVSGSKRAPYASGMYAWNAAARHLVMIYTDSEGALTEGPVVVDAGVLVHELSEANADGSVDQLQVRIAWAGPNAFTDQIFLRKDGSLAPVAAVRYERAAAVAYHP